MKLGCLAGVEYKNKIIFSSTYINGLFELDMNTGKIRLISIIKGEKCEAYLFRKALLFKNEAWFIPQRGNHVLCVNLNTYQIEYVKLQYNKKFEQIKGKTYSEYCVYSDGLIVNDKYLCCIPYGVDSLFIIDLQERHTTYINVWNDPMKDTMYGAYFYGKKVHLLSKNGVLDKSICIEKNDVEEKNWKFDSVGFLSQIQSGTELYLIPAYLDKGKKRRLAKINLVSENVEYIDMPDNSEEYYRGVIINGNLLLFPNCGIDFIKMNIKKKIFEKVHYSNELKNRLKNDNNAARIVASEKRKLSSLIFAGYILEFDKEGNVSNYFEVDRLEQTEIQKIITEYQEKGIRIPTSIMQEEKILSLWEYIQLI